MEIKRDIVISHAFIRHIAGSGGNGQLLTVKTE